MSTIPVAPAVVVPTAGTSRSSFTPPGFLNSVKELVQAIRSAYYAKERPLSGSCYGLYDNPYGSGYQCSESYPDDAEVNTLIKNPLFQKISQEDVLSLLELCENHYNCNDLLKALTEVPSFQQIPMGRLKRFMMTLMEKHPPFHSHESSAGETSIVTAIVESNRAKELPLEVVREILYKIGHGKLSPSEDCIKTILTLPQCDEILKNEGVNLLSLAVDQNAGFFIKCLLQHPSLQNAPHFAKSLCEVLKSANQEEAVLILTQYPCVKEMSEEQVLETMQHWLFAYRDAPFIDEYRQCLALFRAWPRTQTISMESFEKLLIDSSSKDKWFAYKAVIQHHHFQKISVEVFAQFFKSIRPRCLGQLIENLRIHPRYREVSNTDFEFVLIKAVGTFFFSGDEQTAVYVLLDDSRYKEISLELLGKIFVKVMTNCDETACQLLLQHPRYSEISPNFLASALRSLAALSNKVNRLRILMNHPRFGRISAEDIKKARDLASDRGDDQFASKLPQQSPKLPQQNDCECIML